MSIVFTKMQALGNDFVVIDALRQIFVPEISLIKKIADRHYGIGCDQILLIEKSRTFDTDFFYRIFNADGTEAEMCGNGARCIAKFLEHENLTTKKHIVVGTKNSKLELILEDDGEVSVNIGIFDSNPRVVTGRDLLLPDLSLTIQNLSLGNPHAVLEVKNVLEEDVPNLGAAIAKNEYFLPDGVNVEFMEIVTKNQIKLRVYERGVGESLACGSGACAAVVVGRLNNLLTENVVVSMPGGDLSVSWAGMGTPVWLKGEAQRVFFGNWGY